MQYWMRNTRIAYVSALAPTLIIITLSSHKGANALAPQRQRKIGVMFPSHKGANTNSVFKWIISIISGKYLNG